MRIAVFSDVHGNLDAFEAVQKKMEMENPDHYVFCGDICGYYYQQNEIIGQMLRMPNLTAIKGNHDESFLRLLENDGELDHLCQTYGSGYRRLKDQMTPDTLSYLKSLSDSYVDPSKHWAVFHGSPWNSLHEYIYPTHDLRRFETLSYKFVFLGHTHYPMNRKAGNVRVVNPGSCGQPRDEKRPSFALVDTDKDEVTIHRVSYNADRLRSQIDSFDPTLSYLKEVLDRQPNVAI